MWYEIFVKTIETIYMVSLSGVISIIGGLSIAIVLFLASLDKGGCAYVSKICNLMINAVRSVPFLILVILLMPLTAMVIGSSIGVHASIVVLSISAIPHYARLAESALLATPKHTLESASVMGASTYQSLFFIILPECYQALCHAATTTLIAIVGYSAMVGIIGGGGLGELAINYGYYQYQYSVMIMTVVVIVLFVQAVQMIGDRLAYRCHLKAISLFMMVALAFVVVFQYKVMHVDNSNRVKIGVMKGTQERIYQELKQHFQKQFHVEVDIIGFDDYFIPNKALDEGSIDINIFQHEPFLEKQIATHGYQIKSAGKNYVYPLGFYSNQVTSLAQLKQNSKVIVPVDPSNQCRALRLLENHQIIQVDKQHCDIYHIEKNPYKLKFKSVQAAMTPKLLSEAALVAITNDFMAQNGLGITQAIVKEDAKTVYANIAAIRANEQRKIIQDFVTFLLTKQAFEIHQEAYPPGAVLAAK